MPRTSDFSVKVALECTVSRTEDPEKVLIAMRNVFGDCPCVLNQTTESISMTSGGHECLHKMHDQLRDRRIRGSARRLALRGLEGNRVTFMINRQAAYQGIVALCGSEEESPLGPIFMTLESNDLMSVIDWLTAYPTSR